jgi:hypothetical protein
MESGGRRSQRREALWSASVLRRNPVGELLTSRLVRSWQTATVLAPTNLKKMSLLTELENRFDGFLQRCQPMALPANRSRLQFKHLWKLFATLYQSDASISHTHCFQDPNLRP